MRELSAEDSDSYSNFVRKDPQHFQMLLARRESYIAKQTTNMCECISPSERLAVTLRFLAAGDSYQSLVFLYCLGKSTIGEIIPDTCRAITVALKDQYLKVPNTTQEWEAIARAFEEKWNFPHCIGVKDGKNIAMKAPLKSGSMYFNYKDFHSVVLLAVVDAFYRFIWYDVGENGRNNGAGIFACTTLSKAVESKTLQVPAPRELAHSHVKMPFVLVGDEAFPLKEHLMKPYPRGLGDHDNIFNYRLNRVRRVSENAFGILVNRFRLLLNTLNLSPDVVACVT
ncbi:putative nuclease HARBI1 [Pomacea canaliculata]|uniref:putative nuclease HARBI1 n=1 Tax=Pomacea canaliculata TaxID=400727 RepID=UPI000D73B3C7|nr:putative nuclease HARBI1 [Pomacea canaliculata]